MQDAGGIHSFQASEMSQCGPSSTCIDVRSTYETGHDVRGALNAGAAGQQALSHQSGACNFVRGRLRTYLRTGATELDCCAQVIDEVASRSEAEQAVGKLEAQTYLSDIEGILRTAAAAVNGFSQQSHLRRQIQELTASLEVMHPVILMVYLPHRTPSRVETVPEDVHVHHVRLSANRRKHLQPIGKAVQIMNGYLCRRVGAQ